MPGDVLGNTRQRFIAGSLRALFSPGSGSRGFILWLFLVVCSGRWDLLPQEAVENFIPGRGSPCCNLALKSSLIEIW